MSKVKKNKQIIWRYAFALALIIVGVILSYNQIGNEFLGFSSIGNWLTYVGFIMLVIITLQLMSKKKKLIDERMEFVASKASKITFLGIILTAFITMIIDGISPITTAYSLFMSYFIVGIVLLYIIAYKILLKYY